MALQTSGSISFSQIQNEFGGSSPVSASEYYRGAAYVPTQRYVPPSGSDSYNAVLASENESLSLNDYVIRDSGPYPPVYTAFAGNTYVAQRASAFSPVQIPSSIASGSQSGYVTTVGNTVQAVRYLAGTFRSDRSATEKEYSLVTQVWNLTQQSVSTSGYYVNINTGIPSSGTVRMGQFYGGTDS